MLLFEENWEKYHFLAVFSPMAMAACHGRISLHSFAYVNKQENWVSHCRNINLVVAWTQAQVLNSNSTSAVQDPLLNRLFVMFYWFLINHFYNQYRIQRPGKRGPRNMKSMQLPSAAIFFMTFFLIFSRAGGGWSPRSPPRSATENFLIR